MPLHPQSVAFLKVMEAGAVPVEPDIDALRAASSGPAPR